MASSSRQNQPQHVEDEEGLDLDLALAGRFGKRNETQNKNKSRLASVSSMVETIAEGKKAVRSGLRRGRSCPDEKMKQLLEDEEAELRMEVKRRRPVARSEEEEKILEMMKEEVERKLTLIRLVPPGSRFAQWLAEMEFVKMLRARGSGRRVGVEHTAEEGSSGHAETKAAERNPSNPNTSGDVTAAEVERNATQSNAARDQGMEIGAEALERMPLVYTRANGANARRVEGILFKVRKGGEVEIVCVCHGSFFSARGFVEHAGRGPLRYPLRCITMGRE